MGRRVAALLSCAGVVGGTLVSATVVPSAGAVAPAAPIYLVSNSTTLPAGDLQVKAALQATGRTVTVLDDDTVSAAAVADGGLVVVSSSVVVAKVGAKLANVEVPLLTWEAFLFDDNKLATNVGETSTTTRKIKMASTSHAHGLTGEPLVYSSPSKVSYGTVPASAVKIANVLGTPHRAVVFWYDDGALRTDGSPAPQCRAGFFADYAGANKLSTNGVTLFDGLVEDLLACSVPPPPVDSDSDGLADVDEPANGCLVGFPDSDLDGLTDGVEVNTYHSKCDDTDSDNDLLSDGEDIANGCSPINTNSDSDNFDDGQEVLDYGTDCSDADTDADGLDDYDDFDNSCDPLKADTDGDGLTDSQELDENSYCDDTDSDDDGLDDGEEYFYDTTVYDPDTDNDGLLDGPEVKTYHTDPSDADTDDGGVNDGIEIGQCSDPLNPSDDRGADRTGAAAELC